MRCASCCCRRRRSSPEQYRSAPPGRSRRRRGPRSRPARCASSKPVANTCSSPARMKTRRRSSTVRKGGRAPTRAACGTTAPAAPGIGYAAMLANDLDLTDAVREAQDYVAHAAESLSSRMGQYLPDRLFWARGSESRTMRPLRARRRRARRPLSLRWRRWCKRIRPRAGPGSCAACTRLRPISSKSRCW